MKEQHTKHSALARPDYGVFGRQEWAIVGTPCSHIQQLALALTADLKTRYRIAYVDADHAAADAGASSRQDATRATTHGAVLEYTDKITFHRLDSATRPERQWFDNADLVLVNGNHFAAKQQIVIIDPRKEASLRKRLDQLTDIQLILLTAPEQSVYPFLQDKLAGSVPVLLYNDYQGIAQWLTRKMEAALPPLHGLVLAGGESRRMGHDKGSIVYHGKPQRTYIADLLQLFCNQTFISHRPGQLLSDSAYPLLEDTFLHLGPYGAILSAFRQHPDAAWLVVACDLPLVDAKTLQSLLLGRNRSSVATAFYNPATHFPEPLLTIWEPRAYPRLLQFLAQGYSCPRKVLINSDVTLLEAPNPDSLLNVNLPDEARAVQQHLESTRKHSQ